MEKETEITPSTVEEEIEHDPNSQEVLEENIEKHIMSNFGESKILKTLKELPRKMREIFSKRH